MQGHGLVLDFEGSRAKGIREIGFLRIVNFEILEAGEKITHGSHSDEIISCLFNKSYDFFISHQSSVEKNFLKSAFPVCKCTRSGLWEPWLDTKKIYQRLYPELEVYDLKSLCEAFVGNERRTRLAELYCPREKRRFHNALYDSICCFLLVERLREIINLSKFLSG